MKTTEDFSAGHGHRLPDIDGPRMTVIYGDGCSVVPGDNGSWQFTPAQEDDPDVQEHAITEPRED